MCTFIQHSVVSSLQATAALLATHGAAAGRDAARLTAELLPVLLERCGDANARISKGVEDTISALTGVPDAAVAAHTAPFLRSEDAQQILQQLERRTAAAQRG